MGKGGGGREVERDKVVEGGAYVQAQGEKREGE